LVGLEVAFHLSQIARWYGQVERVREDLLEVLLGARLEGLGEPVEHVGEADRVVDVYQGNDLVVGEAADVVVNVGSFIEGDGVEVDDIERAPNHVRKAAIRLKLVRLAVAHLARDAWLAIAVVWTVDEVVLLHGNLQFVYHWVDGRQVTAEDLDVEEVGKSDEAGDRNGERGVVLADCIGREVVERQVEHYVSEVGVELAVGRERQSVADCGSELLDRRGVLPNLDDELQGLGVFVLPQNLLNIQVGL